MTRISDISKKKSGIGVNQNQNQRYEVSREGFPGYEVSRMGFKSTVFRFPCGMNRGMNALMAFPASYSRGVCVSLNVPMEKEHRVWQARRKEAFYNLNSRLAFHTFEPL